MKRRHFLPLLILFVAFAARVWQLGEVPPGYSDDELSNALVLSQKILTGNWTVYFTDASGHEALFHILVAGTMRLFGTNVLGLRLVSIFLGTLSVALTYQLGRFMWRRPAGLVAAAALSVSFWGMFYSRINQRHVSMPFFLLLSFVLFWWALRRLQHKERNAYPLFVAAGVSLGLGYYTYFASRGVPLILLGFGLFLAVAQPALLRRVWRGLAVTLGLSLLLAIPLASSVRAQADAGADARVEELAVPITAARAGDFGPLRQHVVGTLSMFHARGDAEYLYNVPGRPIFGPLGALFFWGGVLLALSWGVRPWLPGQGGNDQPSAARQRAAVFLLGWWLAGITPGFLSVPPASNSHTIAAQSATYLLAALSVVRAGHYLQRRWPRRGGTLVVAAPALLFLVLLGSRDLRAYFVHWPQLSQVRFLFHADMVDVAEFVAGEGVTDFGVTGLLLGPWDRLALELALSDANARATVQPRWYNPQRAIIVRLAGERANNFYNYPNVAFAFPTVQTEVSANAGDYLFGPVNPEWADLPATDPACFSNGLCWLAAEYDPKSGSLIMAWTAMTALDLPSRPVVSKPPPPGVYDGPRLQVFVHLLDETGIYVRGDDGLWVDPAGLQPGDAFWQQHWLPADDVGADAYLVVGLYDPLTGARIPTETGVDHYRLPLEVTP